MEVQEMIEFLFPSCRSFPYFPLQAVVVKGMENSEVVNGNWKVHLVVFARTLPGVENFAVDAPSIFPMPWWWCCLSPCWSLNSNGGHLSANSAPTFLPSPAFQISILVEGGKLGEHLVFSTFGLLCQRLRSTFSLSRWSLRSPSTPPTRTPAQSSFVSSVYIL